jgi:hypothetical protein
VPQLYFSGVGEEVEWLGFTAKATIAQRGLPYFKVTP